MKDSMKADFEQFILGSETPPLHLQLRVQKYIGLSLRKRSLILKFLSFQLFGAIITLSFCPQFGLGFIDGHGISHFFRMYGDWACAAFCGALFLSSGTLFASYIMDRDELYWIWSRYKFPFIILPTVFWIFLMTLNLSLSLPNETGSYSAIWLASAILGQQLFLKMRNNNYSGILRPIKQ